jgi:hypothetical protein
MRGASGGCRDLHDVVTAGYGPLDRPEVTAPLEEALVGSLDPAELHRALAAAVSSLAAELYRTDRALAARLNPVLAEIGRPP